MKLASILTGLVPAELKALARDKIPFEDEHRPALIVSSLESALRSPAYVEQAVARHRQPPTFAILLTLVESEGLRMSSSELRQRAEAETSRIVAGATSGEYLGPEVEAVIYRRVLQEARRSELDLDTSERALLGVLRRALGMPHVEHFLAEHHRDLHVFWNAEDPFQREIDGLVASGVLFQLEGDVLLPDDLLVQVRNAIDFEIGRPAARRLYQQLAASDLAAALESRGAKTSGTKDIRIDRLIDRLLPARHVLDFVRLVDLREVARKVGCKTSGSREELVERLLSHFESKADLAHELPLPELPLEREPRVLDESRFRVLFSRLRGRELARILESQPQLRQSGSKAIRIGTLWDCHLSEASMLLRLRNTRLRALLERCGLPLSGSKTDRIRTLLNHFATADLPAEEPMLEEDAEESSDSGEPIADDDNEDEGDDANTDEDTSEEGALRGSPSQGLE